MFITLVCWSFASPVGSSPDDNFHLPSIWCGLGERPGLCEDSGDPDTRMVPKPVTTASCYAFDATEDGSCWNADAPGMAEADWMNAIGLYPPVFYATMSVFAGPDISLSVLMMRIVNSAIVVGLLTATFFALPRSIRPSLVISTLAMSVPLGLFVLASTNPSSWAFVSAATLWLCVYATTKTTGRRQLVVAALAVLAAVMGAGARADAAVYAVFGVVIAIVLGLRRGVKLLVPAITAGLVVVISAVFYLTAGQADALASGLPTDNPPLTGAQHLANFLGVPILWWGAFGPSGLGWLDTVPPAMVGALAFGVFAASLFIGVRRLGLRRAVALALAFAALWVVPFVMLAQSRALVGTHVQSRYLLPLMIILVAVASLSPWVIGEWRGPRSIIAGGALAIAMSVALHANIRRYTTGLDSNAADPGLGAAWWWAAAPSPLAVWVIGSLAFAAVFVLLASVIRRPVAAPALHTPVAAREADRAAV